MSSDKVLSQDEIDAMLSDTGGGGNTGSPSSAATPIEGVQPMQAAPQPPTPSAPVTPEAVSQQAQPIAQPATPAPVPAQQPVAPANQQNFAQPQGLDLATQAMINNMAAKIQNLDAAMERVVQLEKALYETNNAVRQLQQEHQSASGQIQLVSSRLEGVLANLKATLGYNAQKTFVCTNCKAKGEVAAEVKCTRCNKKNWWGWWPSKWR